ncbi:MAG: hypothetical protein GY797_20770 [Deltaproteobacteria bacterium]|nr:hypothetical protein [Deltaproteobacteria bacterium]
MKWTVCGIAKRHLYRSCSSILKKRLEHFDRYTLSYQRHREGDNHLCEHRWLLLNQPTWLTDLAKHVVMSHVVWDAWVTMVNADNPVQSI